MRSTLNLSLLLTVTLFSFFIFGCASTKKGEEKPYASEEERQQQDLNDIESLLGISSDQPQQESTPQSNEGEKLQLLDTGEINQQQSNTSATMAAAQQSEQETEKYKKEVSQLKRQLKEKDRTIAQLNTQLDEKSAELQQKKSAPATAFSLGNISDEEYKSVYEEGRAAFEARQYRQAIQYFESLLASSTINPLADNAQYWIGECHYALRQYDAAIIDFEKVLTFPRSNKKADAQFKLGLCYLKKGQKERAIEEFTRLQEDFPNSPYNSRAQAILAKF